MGRSIAAGSYSSEPSSPYHINRRRKASYYVDNPKDEDGYDQRENLNVPFGWEEKPGVPKAPQKDDEGDGEDQESLQESAKNVIEEEEKDSPESVTDDKEEEVSLEESEKGVRRSLSIELRETIEEATDKISVLPPPPSHSSAVGMATTPTAKAKMKMREKMKMKMRRNRRMFSSLDYGAYDNLDDFDDPFMAAIIQTTRNEDVSSLSVSSFPTESVSDDEGTEDNNHAVKAATRRSKWRMMRNPFRNNRQPLEDVEKGQSRRRMSTLGNIFGCLGVTSSSSLHDFPLSSRPVVQNSLVCRPCL